MAVEQNTHHFGWESVSFERLALFQKVFNRRPI